MSALGGKADIDQPLLTNRDLLGALNDNDSELATACPNRKRPRQARAISLQELAD
jgi:hypothetical protein